MKTRTFDLTYLFHLKLRKIVDHRLLSLKVNVRILDVYEELRDGNNLLLLLELLCKTNLVSLDTDTCNTVGV